MAKPLKRKQKTKEPDCYEIVVWERDKHGNPVRQTSKSSSKGYEIWKFFNQNSTPKRKKTKAATAQEAKEVLNELYKNENCDT